MKRILLLLVCIVSYTFAVSQTEKISKTTSVEQKINDQNFRFHPNYMLPNAGSRVFITDGSFLQIDNGTLRVDLPFMGRAFTAQYGGDSGIRLTTQDFTYSIADGKKGRKEITIVPKNFRIANKLIFVIAPDGSANLTITSTDRTPIYYDGKLSEPQTVAVSN